MQALEKLNAMSDKAAREVFLGICHSRAWGNAMIAARPYVSLDTVLKEAGDVWQLLGHGDWLEAAAHHPRLGEKHGDVTSLEEQRSLEPSAELKILNDQYWARFGFVFLLCATGKSSIEVLDALKARLKNDRETEVVKMRDEIQKITELRLKKMLETL